MNRGWLPLILGLLLGLVGGLYYAWIVDPVEYVDTAPTTLRRDFRDDYLALIASAYAATGDLDRARARLALFPDPNLPEYLAALAQQRLATGGVPSEARALAQLAAALGQRPTPLAGTPSPTPPTTPQPATPPSPFPSLTPTRTPPPPPTRTPTATPGVPFRLVAQDRVCDPSLGAPLLQVEVLDQNGEPVPGVEVRVIWDTGQDHFFTGLKPEISPGYGDFTMEEGVTYTLQVVGAEGVVTGLKVEDCVDDEGNLYPGSWRLVFARGG